MKDVLSQLGKMFKSRHELHGEDFSLEEFIFNAPKDKLDADTGRYDRTVDHRFNPFDVSDVRVVHDRRMKESEKAGKTGVMDLGDRSDTYVIDLDEVDSMQVLGSKHNGTLREIMRLGEDGVGATNDEARFQNGQLGLTSDDETGLHGELKALIDEALDDGNTEIVFLFGDANGSDDGKPYIELLVAGRYAADVLRFEGDDIGNYLKDLAKEEILGDLNIQNVNTGFDLLNNKEQEKVFDYGSAEGRQGSQFHGRSDHVKDQDAKALLDGSGLNAGEAAELVTTLLNKAESEGWNGEGVHVSDNFTIELHEAFGIDSATISLDVNRSWGWNIDAEGNRVHHSEMPEVVDTMHLFGDVIDEAIDTWKADDSDLLIS